MTSIAAPAPMGLASLLREQTRSVHELAESAPFIGRLLSGTLPLGSYVALVVQNHAIYEALEVAGERWRTDPVAGPFVLDELLRLPRLEADLTYLLGPRWRRKAEDLRLAATDRYVARLQLVCEQWPAGFVAHHYVRYLGDLSGGQLILRALDHHYGEVGRHGATFYVFDQIERIKPFRDAYRTLLDEVAMDIVERQRLISEAIVAFELNRDVLAELT